ncbi:hypothetical protein KPH14_003567 [Odynerus spinipes]|uniref:Replication protein A middle subunit n=1 Tax=Odynerus spinipes TaxID=1348599 RepID=A0AAD9RDJ5_9HYME|nr:hypothetical protein KPH14_003567 [Odynerus spinipes]
MNTSTDTFDRGVLNCSASVSRQTTKPTDPDNIVPVTISDITRSSGEIKIWGMPVHIMTFVGILRKMEESAKNITYEFEDDTDTITGFQWQVKNSTTADSALKINSYVRVYGSLRIQEGKRVILVLRIFPLKDLNELTTHLLEVIHVKLSAEKAHKEGTEEPLSVDARTVFTDSFGMSEEQSTVFKIIQTAPDNDNAIERNEIKRRVPPNILPQVDDILNFLISHFIFIRCGIKNCSKSILFKRLSLYTYRIELAVFVFSRLSWVKVSKCRNLKKI